jgi:hypothetical protein
LRKGLRLREFEKTLLRTKFGPKRYEATGYWKRLYKEELHDLYCKYNVMRDIESRIMRWKELESVMGQGDLRTEFWCDNLRETDHLEDLREDERIVLKRIFNKSVTVLK